MLPLCQTDSPNPPGSSKRLSSKAAASEGPEAYPLGYVEVLNDARTPLAGFFSILLPFHQLSVGIVRSGKLRPSPSCRKRNPAASV